MTALYVFVLIVGLAAGAPSGIIGTGSSTILLRVGLPYPRRDRARVRKPDLTTKGTKAE
jgi:hypothetical protein